MTVGDDGWIVGPQNRHRGSLHADRWRGRANELADRGAIAVYPTLGWWRELKRHERFERSARYSLVVSILAPEATVDLYAAIEATIQANVAVTV